MYAVRPPPPAGGPDLPGAPLRLRRAARRVFDGSSALARDPELRVFMGDLIRPYGLDLREDVLAAGGGHTYGEMAEALIAATVPADEPVDLLVLAFGIHDVRPGRSTATYLSHVCPGEPFAFAVCDQGTAAAFTGLRLVREYARTGGCRRALLVVAEQTTLHYRPVVPAPVPARHAAVALMFAESGPTELGDVRQHADVGPDRVGALLAAEVATLCAGRPEVTLVVGADLAGELAARPPAARVLVAPAGQPYTGMWWELAGCAGQRRPVVFADYDRTLRYLCLSALDVAAPPAAAGPPEPDPMVVERCSTVPST